jgi:hypothetical protein
METHLEDGKINYVLEAAADGTYTVSSFDLASDSTSNHGKTEAASIPSLITATVIGLALAESCIVPEGVFIPPAAEEVELVYGGDRSKPAFGYEVRRIQVNEKMGKATIALVAPDGTFIAESKGKRGYSATHVVLVYYPGDRFPVLFSISKSAESAGKTLDTERSRYCAFRPKSEQEQFKGWVVPVQY